MQGNHTIFYYPMATQRYLLYRGPEHPLSYRGTKKSFIIQKKEKENKNGSIIWKGSEWSSKMKWIGMDHQSELGIGQQCEDNKDGSAREKENEWISKLWGIWIF
jgi:hypothetical protein